MLKGLSHSFTFASFVLPDIVKTLTVKSRGELGAFTLDPIQESPLARRRGQAAQYSRRKNPTQNWTQQ